MAEYIDRQEFFKHIRKALCSDCHLRKGIKNGKEQFVYEIGEAPCRGCDIDTALDYVDDYPTADVAPVKHGEWIYHKDAEWKYECSLCGSYFPADWNFCANCGAKIIEAEGGEE